MSVISHQPTGADRLRRAIRLVLVNGLARGYLVPKRWRLGLYRAAGYRIGVSVFFSGSIIRSEQLAVGDNCFVNHDCYFGDGPIRLGDNVFIGPGVSLVSGDHRLGGSAKRAGQDVHAPIVLNEGVWVGARAVILSDVEVARGCVIGAGAVVTASTEPDGLYLGVPARRVRDL